MIRQRLTYLIMSLFVTWQTLVMIVAPAPDSYLSDAIRKVLQPYMSLLRLDSQWDFFAPNVGEGSRLRVIVEDKDGGQHTFNPAQQLSWFHPSYFWVRGWYYAIMDNPELYADAAIARFCKQHAALHPAAITLIEMQEERFTREDELAGEDRTDPKFFTAKTIKHAQCPE